MRLLRALKYDWFGIVGELELSKMGKHFPHALVLMVAFQLALKNKKLAKYFTSDAQPYRLCVDYKQPILRPDEVATTVLDGSFDQCLVFLPKDKGRIVATARRQISLYA